MITLKHALLLNSVSCIGFGLLFIWAPSSVSVFLSTSNAAPNWLLVGLGLGLILNGGHLIWSSLNPSPSKTIIRYFSTGDFLWVITTLLLISLNIWITTPHGIVTALIVAALVGILGVLQIVKQKESLTDTPTKPALKWLIRLCSMTVFLLFGLLSFGIAYQKIKTNQEFSMLSPPGKMIAIGENTFYVHCLGPVNNPVIMLENGMGLTSENWQWVQKFLSTHYRVCAYDRAGIGFSKPSSGPVNAASSADNLAALLDALSISQPIILTGHSYGGLIGRVFAQRHPERLAGLVLVDSSHEDMKERLPPLMSTGLNLILKGFSLQKIFNHMGASRILGIASKNANGLDGEAKQRAYYLYTTPHHMGGAAHEATNWEISAESARGVAKQGLGDLPLTVLTAGNWPAAMLPSWHEMQIELSELSSKGKRVLIEEADHYQILSDKRYAEMVAKEIALLAR